VVRVDLGANVSDAAVVADLVQANENARDPKAN